MDPNVQAVIDAMQQQQEHFMTTLKTTRSTLGSSTPRFDTFYKSKENGLNTLRLDQHFVLHNVTDLDKNERFYALVSI